MTVMNLGHLNSRFSNHGRDNHRIDDGGFTERLVILDLYLEVKLRRKCVGVTWFGSGSDGPSVS